LRLEQRPDQRTHTQYREQAGRGGGDADAFGITRAGEGGRARRPCGDFLDRRGSLAPGEVGGAAEPSEARNLAAACLLEDYDPIPVRPGPLDFLAVDLVILLPPISMLAHRRDSLEPRRHFRRPTGTVVTE